MGVQGVGGMEAGAATPFLPIAPTPWRLFGSFLPVQKGTRRRGGETLSVKRTTQRPDEGIGPYEIEAHARHPQKTSQSDHRPPSAWPDGQPPSPIPSGLRPSPLDKGSRPPGGRLNESGRRNLPCKEIITPASASNTSRYKTAHTERPPPACRCTRWCRRRRPPRGPGR